ncbi:MAG: YceI family protein [Bacteriovoracaceae bacterium]|jgi:hypothetical protein|nr:YceI family protein [Bacteriovoracaceae bacterium]
MRKIIYTSFILPLLLCSALSHSASKKGVVISVELSPAGSFEINGKIKGKVHKEGNGFHAKKLTFKISKLKTGLDLRDEHTIKYLSNKGKYKYVAVTAKGSGGNGIGKIKILGKTKKFKFKYVQEGKNIKANFNLSIKDFGFEGISYMGIGVDDQVEVSATVGIK